MFDMRRREFIALLGGAAIWPLAARAQQVALKRIAVLMPESEARSTIAGRWETPKGSALWPRS